MGGSLAVSLERPASHAVTVSRVNPMRTRLQIKAVRDLTLTLTLLVNLGGIGWQVEVSWNYQFPKNFLIFTEKIKLNLSNKTVKNY